MKVTIILHLTRVNLLVFHHF